jgi:hypothetical protein
MATYYETPRDGIGFTKYTAVGKPLNTRDTFGGNNVGEFPVARLEVYNPREIPLLEQGDYDIKTKLVGRPDLARLSGQMLSDRYDIDEINEAQERQRNTPQMFYPRQAEFFSLFSDPSMRHTVGTLAGLAINQFGPRIRASSSLSKHSSRLVQRGMEAGVVGEPTMNPSGEANNSFDFEPVTEIRSMESPTGTRPAWYDAPGKEISKPRVDDARRTVHGLLRPKTSPEQFGPFLPDPQLPGMEGY